MKNLELKNKVMPRVYYDYHYLCYRWYIFNVFIDNSFNNLIGVNKSYFTIFVHINTLTK